MRLAFFLLAAVAVLGLGAALINANVGQSANRAVPVVEQGYVLALALTPPPTVEMPQIPAYPGARLINDVQSNKPPEYARDLSWDTDATDSEVRSFYQASLSKQGWGRLLYPTPNPWTEAVRAQEGMPPLPTPLIPNKNDDPSYPLLYYWSDRTGLAPYKFKVAVGVDHFSGAEDRIYADIIRVPDEDKIPVLPSAEQIDLQNSQDGGGRFITYLTDTRPEESYAFYERGLRYYGWWTIEHDDPSYGLEFTYYDRHLSTNGPIPGLSNEISGRVFVKLDTSGKTKVRIEIVGLKAFAGLQTTP
jgi:hypothetical protein